MSRENPRRLSIARALPSRRLAGDWLGLSLAVGAALLILRLPFPFGPAIIVAAVAGLALLLAPWFGLAALVISVPVQDAGAFAFGGVALTATKLALAGVVVMLVFQLTQRGERIRGSSVLLVFGLYIATMFISLFAASSLAAGFAEIYRWLVSFFALLFALYAIRTRRHILIVVSLMGAGALFEAMFGVAQSVLNLGPASFAVSQNVSRAFGTFGKPNSYAAYLELTTPLVGAVAVWCARTTLHRFGDYRRRRLAGMEQSRESRIGVYHSAALTLWLAACAGAGLLGIGASFSRGAWLGASAAVLAMLIILDKRVPILLGVAGIVLAVVLAAGGGDYAPAVVRERVGQLASQLRFFDSREVMLTDENFAAVERMSHWQTGIAMFLAHPLAGVGAGNFNVRFSDFAVNHTFFRSQGHAHNYYIHAAAETGMIGLSAYFVLIGTALAVCLNAARSAPTSLGRAIGIGAFGVTVALLVHNVVENLHVLNLGIQLSVVWGLAVIGARYLPPAVSERA